MSSAAAWCGGPSPSCGPWADRRAPTTLLRPNDECDAREVDGNRVVRQELGQRPGGHSGRPDGVGVRRGSERERDRELVGADGVRAVTVVPLAEVTAQPVVDGRAKLLQSV